MLCCAVLIKHSINIERLERRIVIWKIGKIIATQRMRNYVRCALIGNEDLSDFTICTFKSIKNEPSGRVLLLCENERDSLTATKCCFPSKLLADGRTDSDRVQRRRLMVGSVAVRAGRCRCQANDVAVVPWRVCLRRSNANCGYNNTRHTHSHTARESRT